MFTNFVRVLIGCMLFVACASLPADLPKLDNATDVRVFPCPGLSSNVLMYGAGIDKDKDGYMEVIMWGRIKSDGSPDEPQLVTKYQGSTLIGAYIVKERRELTPDELTKRYPTGPCDLMTELRATR